VTGGRWIPAVLMLLPAAASGQQEGLPAGAGWLSAGAASLVLEEVPPWTGTPFLDGPALWLAGSRPWGVAGIEHAEAAGAVRAGDVILSAGWRQVRGAGLVQRYAEVGLLWRPQWGRSGVGLTVAGRRLAGEGMHPIGTGVLRLAAGWGGKEGGRGAVALILPGADTPAQAAFVRLAGRWRTEGITLAAGWDGGALSSGALSAGVEGESWKLRAGGWGTPLAPAVEAEVRVGPLRLGLGCRWVRGLGSGLLSWLALGGRP